MQGQIKHSLNSLKFDFTKYLTIVKRSTSLSGYSFKSEVWKRAKTLLVESRRIVKSKYTVTEQNPKLAASAKL